MISAGVACERSAFRPSGFSAIARSVMISATSALNAKNPTAGFSAIARSVMISAYQRQHHKQRDCLGFSAIARSVMISAAL